MQMGHVCLVDQGEKQRFYFEYSQNSAGGSKPGRDTRSSCSYREDSGCLVGTPVKAQEQKPGNQGGAGCRDSGALGGGSLS